jgi:aminopeptidase
MKDPRLVKLVKNLLEYAIELKPGEKLYLEIRGFPTLDLAKELIVQCTQKGGIPFWYYNDESVLRHWLLNATEEQMKEFGKFHLEIMKSVDAYLGLRGSENFFDLSDIPEEKMKLYQLHYFKPVHLEERVKRKKWCVLRYPSNSFAQMAEMSTEQFEDFFYKVCNLDYSQMSKGMDLLVELLKKTDMVRIVGPGTDLKLSIKEMPWVKCDGKINIPDGELFSAPIKNSVNGHISFNTPSLYDGVAYDGVRLEFESGKIVKSTCKNNPERLEKILNTDEGARYVGEFSFGLNPGIKKPMKDILFDEKISGSIHLTPGNCYDEANNDNKSAIHWDLVLIQTKEYGGGEIYFDDKLIRKEGKFIIPELEKAFSEEGLGL